MSIGVDIVELYDPDRIAIGTLASHTALQILHGAKKEGFRTVLITMSDRLSLYNEFKHLIDRVILVDSWRDLCRREVVVSLQKENTILVPHGSFVEYVGIDCAETVEVPIFGLRKIFRVEASQHAKMDLLKTAGIDIPRSYSLDDNVDRLVIVKLPGAKGGRGFFLASSRNKIVAKLDELRREKLIDSYDDVLIQEYVVGTTAYFHYFYSPILDRVELLGIDIRYEANVDGLHRLPPKVRTELDIEPTFVVVGNIPLVLREKLLVKVYDYGRRFVETTKRLLPPGIIGPFCLESVITDRLEIKVFEFSGRIVAGTNLYISGSPYSALYWDEPMSMGRRIAREIRLAIDKRELRKVVT